MAEQQHVETVARQGVAHLTPRVTKWLLQKVVTNPNSKILRKLFWIGKIHLYILRRATTRRVAQIAIYPYMLVIEKLLHARTELQSVRHGTL